MKKIVIVEDEKSIFFLLNSCIAYEELGLELVGYAENGQIGIEMILEKKPDIIITDVTMPIVDGLQLIEKVKEHNLNPKFIIVSGYAQFEFAQKAVSLGVKDYLLKPINSSELNKSLEKLICELDDGREKKVFSGSTDNYKEKIRTSFIMSMLYKDIDFNVITVNQINQDYFYSFQKGYYCSLVIKVDYYSEVVIGIKNHITEKIISLVKECFSGSCYEFGITEHQGNIYVILNMEEAQQKVEEIKAYCKRIVIRGKKLIGEYTESSLTVCVGAIVSNLYDLSVSFDTALHLLDMRIVRGVDRVLVEDTVSKKVSGEECKYVLQSYAVKHLTEKVECNELAAAKVEISSIFSDALAFCKREDVSVNETMHGVLMNILTLVKQKGNFPDEFMDIYRKISLELDKATRVRDITRTFAENLVLEMVEFQKKDLSGDSAIMKRIKEYISCNFDKELRLDDVAEQVYITPAYLGILFKKETGKNFTTYVTELRMQRAKELLMDVRVNINEIAYRIGYQNVRYFSRTFKEHVGITPKEYRKIHANRIY